MAIEAQTSSPISSCWKSATPFPRVSLQLDRLEINASRLNSHATHTFCESRATRQPPIGGVHPRLSSMRIVVFTTPSRTRAQISAKSVVFTTFGRQMCDRKPLLGLHFFTAGEATLGLRWLIAVELGLEATGTVSCYCEEVRKLGYRIEELISESLGLEKHYIKNTLGEQGQHMAVNFYPPCPEQELTYGLPGHTDPNALTILLKDLGVCGLQVLKDGKWVAINPHPDAFVINIGDQLQALSNGIYKSVWHRAVTNTDKARLSVASFMCPQDDALISALKSLTEDGSSALYRGYTYTEYYKKFWTRNLEQEHCLEVFKN